MYFSSLSPTKPTRPRVTKPPNRTFSIAPPLDRRRGATSVALSVAAHLLLVLFAVRAGQALWEPVPAAGDPSGQGSGGGGGGGGGGGDGGRPRVVFILPPPPPETPPVVVPEEKPAVVTPPVPPPVVEAQPVPDSTPTSSTPTATRDTGAGSDSGSGAGPGTGGGAGGGTGGGTGTGTGPGAGPGTGGAGGSVTPPVWSAGALPFGQTPKSLRGRHVDVTFWVRPDGRVDRIAVEPPIGDAGYLQYFRDVMLTFRFRPARDPSGAAVQGTVTMGFELPTK